MSATYIAIHASTVRHVVQAARKLVDDGDLKQWKDFCDRVSGVSMSPALSLSPQILQLQGPSLFEVDHHRGFPALDSGIVPDLNQPGFGWIIRTLLEQSAPLRAHGRYDGLRGTLLDGINRATLLASQAEIQAYDRFVETIFDTPAQLSDEMQFIDVEEGFWSITESATLRELLTSDGESVLQTIASRLVANQDSIHIGHELLRVLRICQLAMLDEFDLWTFELY